VPLLISSEQSVEVLHHRLGLAAGAAREQDQSSGSARVELLEERVGRSLIDARQETPGIAIGGDDPLRVHLRQLRGVFGGIAGQGHGEMSGGSQSQQPGSRRRPMVADDGDGGRTGQTQTRESTSGFIHQGGQTHIRAFTPHADQSGLGIVSYEAGEERHLKWRSRGLEGPRAGEEEA